MNFSDKLEDFKGDKRTVSSVLTIDEKSRQYLWNISIEYTLLIDKIFQEIPQDPRFPKWLDQGKLPEKIVKTICKNLKESEFIWLPARVYTAAALLVFQTYKAWFALQKNHMLKLQGKWRWLEVMETDLELAENTDITSEMIRVRAAEILTEIETQRSSTVINRQEGQGQTEQQEVKTSQSSNSLMSFLFQRWKALPALR